MKIGCFGTRKEFLASVIEDLYHEAILIEDQEDIPNHEIVLASGVHHKIPDRLLGNVFGFHESDLPFGHGCAPLPWTLILDLEYLTVTMFKMDKDFDTGLIVDKVHSDILNKYDNVHTLEEYRDSMMQELIENNINNLNLYLAKQEGRKVYFPRRYRSNSIINISLAEQPLGLVWKTHVRACHNDKYPCIYQASELYYSFGKTDGHVPTKTKFKDLEFPCSFTVDGMDITLSRQK